MTTSGADHSIDKLKHCWNCGVKFGPKPKPGPTEGEWYYDNERYAIRAMPHSMSIGHALSCKNDGEVHANGHLMAASKKLLAACKKLMQEPYEGAARDAAREAIADAEKGMQ